MIIKNKDLRSGFTLLELILVIAIISIVTSAMAPYFTDFHKNQSMLQGTDYLVSNIEAMRTKARAGGVWNPNASGGAGTNVKAWWGIRCNPSNLREIQIGYTPISYSGTPPVPNNPSGFTPTKTYELSKNQDIVFSSGCTSSTPIYFRRLSGELYNSSGIIDGAIVLTVRDGASGAKQVQVNKTGKVRIL